MDVIQKSTRMIKELHIQDFQSHKDSVIEFDSRVTAFVGLNNHGKSAILKAMKKLIRDDPNGTGFIRNLPTPAPVARVRAFLDNPGYTNISVERSVGRGTSSPDSMYTIWCTDGENEATEEFTKFSKTGIPEEVKTTLGISDPQVLDKNVEFDFNIQVQKSNSFLIEGEGLSSIRSKLLSKITGVDDVQKAVQLAKLKEGDLNKQVATAQLAIKQYKVDLKKYDELDKIPVQQILSLVATIDSKSEDLLFCEIRLNLVKDIVAKAKLTKQLIQAATITTDTELIRSKLHVRDLLLKLQKVVERSAVVEKRKSIKTDTDLRNIQEHQVMLDTCESLYSIEERMEELKHVESVKLPMVHKLSEVVTRWHTLYTLYNKLNENAEEDFEMVALHDGIESTLDMRVKEYEELKVELKICPTCLQPFKKAKVK